MSNAQESAKAAKAKLLEHKDRIAILREEYKEVVRQKIDLQNDHKATQQALQDMAIKVKEFTQVKSIRK